MTDVRNSVAEAYTNALRKSQQKTQSACCTPLPQDPVKNPSGACCIPASADAEVKVPPETAGTQNGVTALAGYSEHEQENYGDASQSSFGCGNPLAFAGVLPGQTVVDLGSGAGLDLLIAADKVGPEGHVIGIDMTDAMIEAARANVAKAGKTNVEIRKGFIEELPIETGSVDWVISNCVINLSPDKDKVFAEIARVLKPGGQFSISDIVVEELPDWIRSHAAAYAACIAGAISEPDYLAGLERAGLADVTVTERLVYDADQVRVMVASELENLGLDEKVLEEGLASVAGKVWSAKVVGCRAG